MTLYLEQMVSRVYSSILSFSMAIPFLTAHWKNLLVINFEVDPATLHSHLPAGTELDLFDGKCFVSLVAFDFCKTRLFGFLPIPTAVNFEEINLRFYTRKTVVGEIRRAVTFIKEIVPSPLISWTARALYNEPYITCKTFRDQSNFNETTGGEIAYGFKNSDEVIKISGKTFGSDKKLEEGSLPWFILEHYWGYTAQASGDTLEYRVAHPPWRYWDVSSFEITGNLQGTYGELSSLVSGKAHSVFLAKGSPVSVYLGKKYKQTKNLLK